MPTGAVSVERAKVFAVCGKCGGRIWRSLYTPGPGRWWHTFRTE